MSATEAPPIVGLPGLERHPHARAVLAAALAPAGRPSHAYLFHGPPGTGKEDVARAFAAALLVDGAADPDTVSERVWRDAHPDLTWVRPSGAMEVLVSDVDEPVVAAATRTPFESRRRVFVIEAVETMNDQAANRMLKTLEEPPPFVHVLLLTDRREDVLATIASRCQQVRFDPLPSTRIAEGLAGVPQQRARACARLALGDADRAALLAGDGGEAMRDAARELVAASLAGETRRRPWTALLDVARAAGAAAGEEAQAALAAEVELLGAKERKRAEREGQDARRRAERRARMGALDLGLGLAELWLRDLLILREQVPELVHADDRREQLDHDVRLGREDKDLRAAVELVAQVRLGMALNVSEELALEALAYRLQSLLAEEA